LIKAGFDGIGRINDFGFIDDFTEIPVYATFTPSQIKSATGNTGDFSAESDDIRYKQPYFYSPTEQSLNSIKQEKGTPD
jgi:hypothetical protein